MTSDNRISYKVVFLGASTVGKTSIATRFIRKTFTDYKDSTIGAAYNKIFINDKIAFDMWDTAGQERYLSIVPMYIRDSDVVVIVYDLSYDDTIDRIERNLTELMTQLTKDYRVVIVGNKCDLVDDRTITNCEKKIK
jgi:Ras-related protein Rab-5C